jgi:hypothetical protein
MKLGLGTAHVSFMLSVLEEISKEAEKFLLPDEGDETKQAELRKSAQHFMGGHWLIFRYLIHKRVKMSCIFMTNCLENDTFQDKLS